MTQNNPYINQPNQTTQNPCPDPNRINNTGSTSTMNHAVNQDTSNIYPNNELKNPYTAQTTNYAADKKKQDTIYTQTMKKNYPFFGIGSLLYAFFLTFCLYRNVSGITYPFFVAGTLCYFFFSMRKLGVPYKKDSIFYVVSLLLLGLSNCLTNSDPLLFFNICGIMLLSFILMLHTMYEDQKWDLPKYFIALTQTAGTIFVNCFSCIGDLITYCDIRKKEKDGKNSHLLPVFIGIAITIPVLFIMVALLASADYIFLHILMDIFDAFNFVTIFEILYIVLLTFFISYAVYAALCIKNIDEKTNDHRFLDPIIAIIMTTALSALYLIFSVIQILYLFIGNMKLPDGYTYSSYAREGFFQLLAVCFLNLILVLVCLYFFRENTILKVVLTIISGCTFIMICSSALRMLMYIQRYNLTFLRILVLWGLAVIFLLMAGVTVFIYKNKFPLFRYAMVIVTVFYICLSFSHPDYWIARYNLKAAHLEYLDQYDIQDNQKYLARLSADAAPILLDKSHNLYISENTLSDFEAVKYDENLGPWEKTDQFGSEYSWLYKYYDKMDNLNKKMHIRNFNFSVHLAGKYLNKE